jgi:hypothetical protein
MPWPKRENTGSSKPNSAMDGKVSSTVALLCSGRGEPLVKRVIRIPKRHPDEDSRRPTAMPTSHTCCAGEVQQFRPVGRVEIVEYRRSRIP